MTRRSYRRTSPRLKWYIIGFLGVFAGDDASRKDLKRLEAQVYKLEVQVAKLEKRLIERKDAKMP